MARIAMNEAICVSVLSTCVFAAFGGWAPGPVQHGLHTDGIESVHSSHMIDSNQSDSVNFKVRAQKPKFRLRSSGKKKNKDGSYGERPVSVLPCGTSSQVKSDSDKRMVCPVKCPYYAQDLEDDKYCSFKCVALSGCMESNPKRPIGDFVNGHKVCRGPLVPNCHTYVYDGTDTCGVCGTFYANGLDGQCHYRYYVVITCVLVPLVAVFAVLVLWFVNISCRPIVNKLGLKQGHACRSQAKVNTPFVEDSQRSCYPVPLTNMCKHEEVAGPGMLLHFNFQFMCMVWAFGIALIWYCFAKSIDEDMFVLGTRRFGTPRENCILVAWGYETQQRLMPAKVAFLLVAYLFTFIGGLIYSVRQQRMLDVMDAENKTMKDFVALLSGIGEVNGGEDVEAHIKKAVELAVGEKVVGVSICWDMGEQADDLQKALDDDLIERQDDYKMKKRMEHGPSSAPETFVVDEGDGDLAGTAPEVMKAKLDILSRTFFGIEEYVVELACGEAPEKSKDSETLETLKQLKTNGEAFVVFENEQARNAALDKAAASGITLFGDNVILSEVDCEPNTVNWPNLAISSMTRCRKLVQGFGWIFVGLGLWSTLFYGPYFFGQITFNYENGAMPPASTGLIFTLVVCVGNVIMYEVCARVSDGVGFRTTDEREACYMVLYVIACTFNVVLDFVCTYLVALKVARGMNFRTYFGQKIDDIPHFTEQFETYAMQRILAQNAFDYAWPSTFLIPFILEPIVTVYVPYKISQLMVRTHPEWIGRDAELWLACIPFDMGRYGDLQLNMLLGLMIFFFPSGYTLTLFLGMGFSHVYIYMFDHWKVLSAIPKVIYANGNVDWYSQWLLAPITAVLASCLAFKANGQGFGYDVEGIWIMVLTVFAWLLHTVVHTLLLLYVVPMCRRSDLPDPHADMQYSDVSAKLAWNWFTTNPVHCLRSKLIHKHKAPCSFMYYGKEHLLSYNPALGCYFKDQAADTEDYDSFIDWKMGKQTWNQKR